jgi:hypothetical protein
MIAPLTSSQCQLNGRSIALAATLAILVTIAPHEASAKGGTPNWSHMSHFFPISRAEAATVTSPRDEPTTLTIGGCGGKRYRDPISHRCRGPADFGH